MTSLFLTIFVGLLSFSGIAINSYIIFVITLAKQANSVNGMLLIQASVVELALSVSELACSIPNMIRDNPLSSSTSLGLCTFCGFLIGFLRPIAVWTVCGLNCDRYYAISAPLHYGSLISPRKVLMAMSATWISSLILGLPAIISTTHRYRDATFYCTADFGRTTFSVYYSIVYTTFVFILPLILVLTCNLKVLTIARYHKHRIASAIFEVTLSAQVTITHQKNPFSPSGLANRFKRRSASLTVLQIVGSFLIIYVPYYTMVLVDSTSTLLSHNQNRNIIDIPPFFITIASVLLLCSSSINGILYGVKSKVLKKSFQNYWRKKMKKNELNQEIQARTPSTCGSRRPSLTPAMGFFGRQNMRRPSEVSIDTQKSNLLATSYPKFQCANNFSWRPGSSPGLESAVPQNESFNDLKRTLSFRNSPTNHMNSLSSLKIPNDKCKLDDLKSYRKPADKQAQPSSSKNSSSAVVGGNANLILQRFRKVDGADYEALSRSARCKSPKILITRAFSEENESTSDKSSLPKGSSSVTTLLIDTNWKSVSRECIAFNATGKNALLMDYTDDSCSDESQDETPPDGKRNRDVRPVNFHIDTSDSDSNPGHAHHSVKSWPFTNKKKNIQFRIGSVILSEREFSSVGDVTKK